MRKKQGTFKNESGYTFIELMMAVTILALVAMPVLTLLAGGYATLVISGSKTVAVNLCREKIEEVKANGYRHYETIMDGETEEAVNEYHEVEIPVPGFPNFRRETVIIRELRVLSSSETGDFTVDLMTITVTVTWVLQDVERSVSMESELVER